MSEDLTRALTAAREAVELGEKATKGPWDAYYVHDAVRHIARNCRDMWLGGEDCTFRWDRNNDADLIAHAGTHYATVSRALIAQAERVRVLEGLLNDVLSQSRCDPRMDGKSRNTRWRNTADADALLDRIDAALAGGRDGG